MDSSMHEIIFRKNGLFSKEWNKDTKTISEVVVMPKEIFAFLSTEVKVEEGLCLWDLFTYLNKMPKEIFKPFCDLFRCHVDKIYKEMSKETEPEDLDFLQIDQFFELFKESKYNKDNPWMTTMITCSGIKVKEEIKYAIDLSPVSKLKYIPIKINPIAELYILEKNYTTNEKHKFNNVLNLYQFLDAILIELSFFGTDEKKEDFANRLNKQIADIESGKAKTIPWKEVKKKLLGKLGKK